MRMFKRLFGRADVAGVLRSAAAGAGFRNTRPLGGRAHDLNASPARGVAGQRWQASSSPRAEGSAPQEDPVPLHEGTVPEVPGTGSFGGAATPGPGPDDTVFDEAETRPAMPAPAPQSGSSEPFSPEEAGDPVDQSRVSKEAQPPTDRDQHEAPEPDEREATVAGPLTAGTLIADRYRVQASLTGEEAAQLLGEAVPVGTAELYAVVDQRSYERCWSCGSTSNELGQRFCIDCGAPLQNRQVVLARSHSATGESEEFEEGDFWYHLVHPRKQFGSAGITLEVGGYSAEGPHHPNEDSFWVGLAGGCYDSAGEAFSVVALADGMGGYAPGSGLISKEIVRTVGHGIFDIVHAESDMALQEADLRAIVSGAIAQANERVLEQIAQHGEMGATLVTAVIYGHTVYIANVGDSRAYYVSPAGAVTQVTRDQSLIEQQVAAGLLSPDAVYTAIGNNVILHAIGEHGVEAAADWYSHPLEPGSRLLLCSDGYWKTMAHDVWQPDLAQHQPTLHSLARALVEQALAQDSDDNTTVVVVGID
jgi:protein phosphatase